MSINEITNNLNQINKLVSRLPAMAGSIAVRHFKQNFTKQGFVNTHTKKWRQRKRKDKNESTQGKRAILVKTARLKRSIRIIRKTKTQVSIGTDVPYAQIHNEGGTIAKTVAVRSHKRKGHRVKAHNRKMNTTISKRQFMGHSHQLNKKIEQQIEKQINKIF